MDPAELELLEFEQLSELADSAGIGYYGLNEGQLRAKLKSEAYED
jgi:hypothetical protein